MIDCPYYYVYEGEAGEPDPPVDDTIGCGECNCGYLQYESLIPYLAEINDELRADVVKGTELEFKLREEILEVSRLFDIEAGVKQGYFSKAHYLTTEIFSTDGKFIRIRPFVEGTLVVRDLDDIVIDESLYAVKNEHIVYLPCLNHTTCACPDGCSAKRSQRPVAWPDSCYKVSARWGTECANKAVQKAIRDYIIETFRMQDPIVVLANGLSVQRKFSVPYSWESFIKNFKARRKIFSQVAFA